MKFFALIAIGISLAQVSHAVEDLPPQWVTKTAGGPLQSAWAKVRRSYPDAVLTEISGKTTVSGMTRCNREAPVTNGWRYTFFSPTTEKFLLVAACGSSLEGPYPQFKRQRTLLDRLSVSGKYIDSDHAINILTKSGDIPNDGGKARSAVMTLRRLKDSRFPSHPTVWKIDYEKMAYFVDGKKLERFNPARYGVSRDIVISTLTTQSEVLQKRPPRSGIHTAKADFYLAMSYASHHLDGAILLGVGGNIDAWGGSSCTGPGDGWKYYFYYPHSQTYEVLVVCKGFVGPGPIGEVPVDKDRDNPLAPDFLDSDEVMDAFLLSFPGAMHKGSRENFSRMGTIFLRSGKQGKGRKEKDKPTLYRWELKLEDKTYRLFEQNGEVNIVVQ